VLEAPYGDITAGSCLMVLACLAVGLFLLIRPLLDRKLT
jgi:ABC-2 type transport system permease protein